MAEAKLQKLKVTELKELLSKAGLVQSGKKDELVKRLLDAGVTGDDASEELVDLPNEPASAAAAPAPTTTPAAPTAAGAPVTAAVLAPATAVPAATEVPSQAATEPDAATAAPAEEDQDELTPEEKKQKARAERFNIPWVRHKQPAAAPARPAKESIPTAAAKNPELKEKSEKLKPAAIDATPLGISADVLARRAAKFGLPEKKAVPEKEASPKQEEPKKELTAEETAALAAEEEKKRKRAEKFGIATNGSDEPDAKKAKV